VGAGGRDQGRECLAFRQRIEHCQKIVVQLVVFALGFIKGEYPFQFLLSGGMVVGFYHAQRAHGISVLSGGFEVGNNKFERPGSIALPERLAGCIEY